MHVKHTHSIATLTRRAVRRIRAQFGHPSGFWGPAVGWILASRPSNRRRNAWAVSLLNVQPRDRILEIGFGPGLAIRACSRLAVEGHVCGLDHSAEMVRQAARRNREAIRTGRVDLRLGAVECLPAFTEPFDKVLTVNTFVFWDHPIDRLVQLRLMMRPGGRIAIAHQPRGPGATEATAEARGNAIAAALTRAGFSEVRLHTMPLTPPVVCATGLSPFDRGHRP
jgi:SAM-dependent methyltransferase